MLDLEDGSAEVLTQLREFGVGVSRQMTIEADLRVGEPRSRPFGEPGGPMTFVGFDLRTELGDRTGINGERFLRRGEGGGQLRTENQRCDGDDDCRSKREGGFADDGRHREHERGDEILLAIDHLVAQCPPDRDENGKTNRHHGTNRAVEG